MKINLLLQFLGPSQQSRLVRLFVQSLYKIGRNLVTKNKSIGD